MLFLPLLMLLAEPPPVVHRFVHQLNGAPVGEIELRRTGLRYAYLSRHFFRRGTRSEQRFEPEPSTTSNEPAWASESLLTPHPVGCWPVVSELTLERGEACVTHAGPKATGTLLREPFTAHYVQGQLQKLEVGDSQFVRSDQPVDFKDPFGAGFEIHGEGSALELSPSLKGTRSAAPLPVGGDEDCLAAAKAYVALHGEFEVVLGVIEDEGRGWPHAWVRHRTTGEERDPSRPASADSSPRYLALPSDRAASVYLELLGKRRELVHVARK